jgi:hypothetical protein
LVCYVIDNDGIKLCLRGGRGKIPVNPESALIFNSIFEVQKSALIRELEAKNRAFGAWVL